MGALLAYLGSSFTAVLSWLSAYASARVVLGASVVVALGVAFAAVRAVVDSALSSLVLSAPGWIAPGLDLLPSNIGTVVGVVVSVDVAVFVYRWTRNVLLAKLA